MNKEPDFINIDIASMLEAAASQYSVPGASLAILKDGQIRTTTAGVVNVDTGYPVRPDTMFQIGSITKVFTASLAMQLVEEGRLNLDAPIRDVLSDFVVGDHEVAHQLTARHLVSHTSGLAGDFFTDTGNGTDAIARYVDRCALLPQIHPLGARFSYSNSGYCILGRLIEVLRGKDFASLMTDQIFHPLNMTESSSNPYDFVGRSMATGHESESSGGEAWRPVKTNFSLGVSCAPTGSTTMMSARDLIKFAQMHMLLGAPDSGRRILDQETCRAMQTAQVDYPAPNAEGVVHWGLGWMLMDWRGTRMIGHSGSTLAQHAFLRFDPNSGAAFALLANGGTALDCFYGLLNEIFPHLNGAAPPNLPKAEISDNAAFDLDAYVGEYKTMTTGYKVEKGDGVLIITTFSPDQDSDIKTDEESPKTILFPWKDHTFIVQIQGLKLTTTVKFGDFDADGRAGSLFFSVRLANRV